MGRLRVEGFSLSIDGFGAGLEQSLQDPLGKGGMALHEWLRPTATFRQMTGGAGGTTGIDNEFAQRGFRGIGAWILGRNMFGPVRGAWPDADWKGWWGEEPPYHCPVFVLTHHPRESVAMAGGTVFHFVTDGIGIALDRAREAAGGLDVRIGGGVDTLRQYLHARLIDEMHLAISPVVLGSGERLFESLDLPALGYRCVESAPGEKALHCVVTRT